MKITHHVIVSRFSVPRLDAATAGHHADRDWLDSRIELFRRFFVPSVGRLGVPVILLCSAESADYVAAATRELPWATVERQDDWYGGWQGSPEQIVTRLDTDDAVHEGWIDALEAAPADYEVYCTTRFLRYHPASRRLYARSRRVPSPLAAFRGGHNPYARDHSDLEAHYRVKLLPEPYLLQVVHGGNVSSRLPSWRHFWHRIPRKRLAPFGIEA